MVKRELDKVENDEPSFVEKHKGAIVGASVIAGVAPAHEVIHAATMKILGGEVNGIEYSIFDGGMVIARVNADMSQFSSLESAIVYLSPHIVLGAISYVVLKKVMKETLDARSGKVKYSYDERIEMASKMSTAMVCTPLANGIAELALYRYGDLSCASQIFLGFIYKHFPEFQSLGVYGAPSPYSREIMTIAVTTALTALTIVAAKPIERLASLIKKTVKSLRRRGEVENGVDS
ncbi:TPA: hypothetical protein DCZ16_01040 [Candidatus Peregrinibacteria bacterium]|nr:hypothetical protein [Candidatus Peregrinibacteria bacterium]